MKRTKEQKGITLIALIITIVVLMILAAVAINSITNDGIIGKAESVKNTYNEAQEKEKDILAYYERVLAGIAWTQNGTTVSRNGQILNVGDVVEYDDGLTEMEWRVLGAENGELLLMIDHAYRDTVVKMKGSTFLQQMGELNSICEKFGNAEFATGARAVNAEDINRVTGYNPAKTGTGKPYSDGDKDISDYGTKVTYRFNNGVVQYEYFSNFENKVVTDNKNNYTVFYKVGEKENAKELSTPEGYTVETNYYSYRPETLTSDSTDPKIGTVQVGSPAYEMIFDGNFCLATPYVKTRQGGLIYGVLWIGNNNLAGQLLWASHQASESDRDITKWIFTLPVVSIDCNAKLSRTSESAPWTLSYEEN